MRLVLPAVLLAALAACAPVATIEPVPPAAPSVDAATGVDVNATAECVKQNATEGELALMALGGERAQTATAQVLQKPGTLACLSRAGVTIPGLPVS